FTSRPKRDLLLCVARHRAVTLTRNAPLSKAQSPGISVSRIEPFREFPLPVLPVVESFPGAMSPLGSKEPNEPFLSPHKVFVCIKTTEIRTLSLRATATMATLDATLRGWRWQTERKNSLSSLSFRIADHAA